jgi:hypothetical protein
VAQPFNVCAGSFTSSEQQARYRATFPPLDERHGLAPLQQRGVIRADLASGTT